MRDKILFFINGNRHEVGGEQAFRPVTDLLRYELGQTGTKVVCAEGDCGACTVLLGRLEGGEMAYKPVNSCIQYIYQLDCTHIVTIEGLKENSELNSVQQAMVSCHGAQCGYCTPGIVVAMSHLFQEKQRTSDTNKATTQDIQDALTGNLCRCTGYEAILEAGTAVEPGSCMSLPQLYPEATMKAAFEEHQRDSLEISFVQDGTERYFYNPLTVEDAIAYRKAHPETAIVSGGTDMSVYMNKRDLEPQRVMSLSAIPDLSTLEVTDDHIIVGAKASLMQLESLIGDYYPELARILEVFGAPQIKHAATLAGNIANGSPIADTPPFLFVTDSMIEVMGNDGMRTVNANELYTGYKTLALTPDEIITRILIPRPKTGEALRLYKVSRRKHLDISAFTAAIRMTVSSNTVDDIKIAYGGVGPIVMRLPITEAFMAGKAPTPDTFAEAGKIAQQEIAPISDVRGSKDFRLQLAENILMKFYFDTCAEHSEEVQV